MCMFFFSYSVPTLYTTHYMRSLSFPVTFNVSVDVHWQAD